MLSVVTPSYNQSEFIEETIQSVRRQTYDDVEHIVVDGESDDGTLEILRAYDDDLRWISEPDDGQSDAINKGFEMSEGEIVGWLNADDVYFDTGVFDRVVDYFEEFDADIIYGDIALIDSTSRIMKFRTIPDFDFDRLVRGCFIEQPALFFRKEVVKEFSLVDLRNGMDYEYWLRIAEKSDYSFKHIRDVLAGDRNHPKRKMLAESDDIEESADDLQRQYGASFGWRHKMARTIDIVTSGFPRRLYALWLAIALSRQQLELAFDGTYPTTQELLLNTFRSNQSLVN